MINQKLLKTLLFLLLLSLSTSLFARHSTKKPRIAVLTLKNAGVPKSLAESVTDLLSTELVNTGMFEVIERMQVAKVLNEQGFQQSGITDSSKAVKLGKILNTKNIVVGTVSKLGKSFLVNVKIVNVATGNIIFAVKSIAKREEKLVDACEKISVKLVYKITGIKLKVVIEKPKKRKNKSNKIQFKRHKKYIKDPVKRKAQSSFDELDNSN